MVTGRALRNVEGTVSQTEIDFEKAAGGAQVPQLCKTYLGALQRRLLHSLLRRGKPKSTAQLSFLGTS